MIEVFDNLEYFAQRPTATAVTKRRARSTAELAGLSGSKQVAEYQWRFVMPLIALFMALTAIELARVKPRQSPYPRYMVALVVYAMTFAGANIAMSAVENESLPRIPGVYAAVLLPFVAFVLARTARFG
jgi:lipopolysaccharide export system permease protein